MDYLSGEALLEGLPLLLAGPVLRRTEAAAVTVWVALKNACDVSVKVLETQDNGQQLGQCVFQGQRKTVALGKNLHVVAVSAKAVDSHQNGQTPLQAGRVYAYDLTFTRIEEALPQAERTYSLEAAIDHPSQTDNSISYFAHGKPTFVLPPKSLSDLKIVHGSCRKPHGEGFDALPILDSLIEVEAGRPCHRPHQLFMTGDQIYGDDVANPLLWIATPLGNTLLGWEEGLPVAMPLTEGAVEALPEGHQSLQPHGESGEVLARQLPAGKRANFSTQQAGLTAGLTNKSERTTSHLFSFGEYCAIYVLSYSPTCWPASLPQGRDATEGRKRIRRWDNDRRNMGQFFYSLWKVRRLVANIPTYTIFDDHDISDDWNLNQEWCLRTLGKPLGRRTVRNALLAYAVFQGWGNTPRQFESDETGAALLRATETWSRAAGEHEEAESAIATYLGLPPNDPHTGLPQLIEDSAAKGQRVWILKRSDKTLRWHYTIRSACHEVIVLDTRTWRGYPIDGNPTDPPMLMSPTAFRQQLDESLSQAAESADSCLNSESLNSDYRTFIIAPTNVFGMRVLDWIQQWHLEQRKTFTADVGDSWNFHDQALATLLTTLFRHRKKIVVLSGDIHYSSVIHVDYRDAVSGEYSSLVQFTSSALKNEETLTRILHSRLKDWLLPERSRQWIGWHSPPNMMECTTQKPDLVSDWHIQMKWLKRQRAESVELRSELSDLLPERPKPRLFGLAWLKFWRTRWLQEGREVVGVNNIALVSFAIDSTVNDTTANDTVAPPAQNKIMPSVRQSHYWFSPWSPTQVVCSRFE